MLSYRTVRALARALGVEHRLPVPMSMRQVHAILARWIAARDGSRLPLGEEKPVWFASEPGRLLWCCTVAAKVSRCPRHTLPERVLPWQGPAVEVAAFLDAELDGQRNEIAGAVRLAMRSRDARALAVAKGRLRALHQADDVLRRLKATRAYREGMEQLAEEFGRAVADDPGFVRVMEVGG